MAECWSPWGCFFPPLTHLADVLEVPNLICEFMEVSNFQECHTFLPPSDLKHVQNEYGAPLEEVVVAAMQLHM